MRERSGRNRGLATAEHADLPRRVWVTGRTDVGEVIDPGKVIGHRPSLLCVGVHFPQTGEVIYFDAARVVDVDPTD